MISFKNISKIQNKVYSEEDFLNFEKSKVEKYNAKEGHLNLVDELDCPICKNKGLIAYMDENNTIVFKDCECMDKRTIRRRAFKSPLASFLKVSSKDYLPKNETYTQLRKMMISFNTNHAEDNVWFALFGQSGCGKTTIACIIANYLMFKKDRDVLYLSWQDFINKFKRDLMNDNVADAERDLDLVKNVDVLLIDELLQEYNPTDLKYAFEIINYRYLNDKKTIVTTELQKNELIKIKESLVSRIIQKCKGDDGDYYYKNIARDIKNNYRLNED